MSGDDVIFEPFGSVAIIGVGMIGGSLGQAIKTRGLAREVVGIGRSAERLQRAKVLEAIDRYSLDLTEGLYDCDLIVLCTPVQHILQILPGILKSRHPKAIVTDVGSTKTAVTMCAGDNSFFVGSHPMTGSEQAGVEAATPSLFVSTTWAVTPADKTSPSVALRIIELAKQIGAHVLTMTPAAHDAIVAVTSHLPHILASALSTQGSVLSSNFAIAPEMSAGSFADATRVAASHPEIWRDICLTNREAILDALGAYRKELDTAFGLIEAGDAHGIEDFFRSGAEAKRSWKKKGS